MGARVAKPVTFAPTFEQARADFEMAWRAFSARRSPADYKAWRDQRDWTARK
jgi:hypothetical protein